MTLWAIIPIKSFHNGKSRLAGCLSDEERISLTKGMFINLLQTLKFSTNIADAVIVSHDEEVRTVTESFNFRYLQEPSPFSLNHAVEAACQFCLSQGASEVLILPADMPLVNQESLQGLISKDTNPPIVVVAPDRHEAGTNALLINPMNGFSFHFGENSFALHQKIAESLHYRVVIVHTPEIELDLDLPEDLVLYRDLVKSQPMTNGG